MSNIDKHALNQEKIEWLNKLADMEYCKSNPGHWLMSLKDTNMLAQLALHSQALLDELEAKDRNWAAQDDHINQQADLIESLEKKNGDLGRALGAAEKRIAELTEALRQSVIGYKSCLHMGHDRILDLGGDCDAPEVMIAGNPDIQQAEKLLAAGTAKGE